MSHSASRSSGWGILLAAVTAVASVGVAVAELPHPVSEATSRIWPDAARIDGGTHVIDAPTAAAIERLAGTAPPRDRTVRVVARGPEGAVLGYAYTETHVVRTKPETLLIVVAPGGTIVRIDVLMFAEPPEYELSKRWFAQFEGAALSRDLRLKRRIATMAGATLSARAATDAARRVLALHSILIDKDPP